VGTDRSPGQDAEFVNTQRKRWIPQFLSVALRDCAGLPPRALLAYWRLKVARMLGRRVDTRVLVPRPGSVLFVCSGNIMRSPFAAEMSRVLLSPYREMTIRSAGTTAGHDRPADPRALAAAVRYSFSLEKHRSQLVSAELVDASDLICVMDSRNEAELVARFPHVAAKTILLGTVHRRTGEGADIPDPYALDDSAVTLVYDRLAAAVDALVRCLA
jgi:protein-tyrosine phosphatase